jgi:hypothetical protein
MLRTIQVWRNQAPVRQRVRLTPKFFVAELLLSIIASALSCGPAAPKGDDYLGKWEGNAESLIGNECHLDISAVGQSYVVKSERQRIGNCAVYEGIWTLTPEGNLKGGPLGNILISYDKKTSKAVVSGLGQLRYLTRPTQDQLDVAAFEGNWRMPSKNGEVFHLEELGGGRFTFRSVSANRNGFLVWGNRWPAHLTSGVLTVSFAEGSAKITKGSDNTLSYEESQGFVEGPSGAAATQYKAERVP